MSEFSFSQNPEWSSLDAWRQVLPSGDAVLLDPARGEPANGRYDWLMHDRRILDGTVFILQHASEIELTVVRGPHASGAGDELAQRYIATSDIAGVEGVGAWVDDGYGPSSTNDDRLQRGVQAAAGGGTSLFVYDAQANSPIELDQLICRMGTLWDPRYGHHPAQQGLTPLDRLEWFVVEQAFREPYIFGSYGSHLMQRWNFLGKNPVRGCLTIGSGHDNVPAMFQHAGLQVTDLLEPSDEQAPTKADPITQLAPLMIRAGLIPAALRNGNPK